MPSLLKTMLPSVGGFAIFSDGYFLTNYEQLDLTCTGRLSEFLANDFVEQMGLRKAGPQYYVDTCFSGPGNILA